MVKVLQHIGTFWKVSLLEKNSMYSTAIWKQSYYRFQGKSGTIKLIFANQCSLINSSSRLSLTLSHKANERLSSVKITDDEILKIIAKLDPNKAHGHDQISIRMIKICSTSICKPLRLTFNHCIDNGNYPCEWKKAVPIHKKGDKTLNTIVRCLYVQCVVKFLKDSYIMRCLVSFLKKA